MEHPRLPVSRWLWRLLIACWLVAKMATSSGDSFTSIESIKATMRLDRTVASFLKDHLDDIPDPKDQVKEYIEERERMEQEIDLMPPAERAKIQEVTEDVLDTQMSHNPLHAFQTIRRIGIDAAVIASQLAKVRPELADELRELLKEVDITYKLDVTGAAKGLIRLQGIYHLLASDLVSGNIRHLQTHARLTIGDCLLLGQVAKEQTRLDLYVEWMEQAHHSCLELTNGQEGNPCAYTTGTLLAAAAQEHDENMKDHGVQILPLPISNTSAMEQLTNSYATYDPHTNPFHEKNLCYESGPLMTPEEKSELQCHYWVRRNAPYVTLKRYKVEMHSKTPPIVTFYDVITDEEADFIKEMAAPKLARSTVVGKTDRSAREFSEQRISSTAWVADHSHVKIREISQRISDITGFRVDGRNAEQFQVVNYGIGGMYNAHYDYLYKHHDMEKKYNETGFMGNRIITFILYLTDVELGGATAFPNAKTAVRPKKGAAAMWFNINEYGVPDEKSFHGGCPVLYGSKWISNKWILERGQLFALPCPAKAGVYKP